MVSYWLGTNPNEGARIIQEIANSRFESEPWTPKILYNDIMETWKESKNWKNKQ
jgi:hypothetical protein